MQKDEISGIYLKLIKETIDEIKNKKGLNDEFTKIIEEKLKNLIQLAMLSKLDDKNIKRVIEEGD
jgi:N-acetylglucosamine kinase-like BadF-type ATPase